MRVPRDPGVDHPITIEPTRLQVSVALDGIEFGRTADALVLHEAALQPVYYLPLDDVDASVLVSSETTSYCPYKGDCSYLSVILGATTVVDAAWRYERPYPAVAQIAGRLAFYPSRVELTVLDVPTPREPPPPGT